jgi:predicted RNase H-like HicB family nuclease
MARYAVVIENGRNNYSAYVPDLPGCVSTGGTLDELIGNIREAIELHLEGMRAESLSIPEPSQVEYIEVP